MLDICIRGSVKFSLGWLYRFDLDGQYLWEVGLGGYADYRALATAAEVGRALAEGFRGHPMAKAAVEMGWWALEAERRSREGDVRALRANSDELKAELETRAEQLRENIQDVGAESFGRGSSRPGETVRRGVRICFEDAGEGMDEESLRRAFDPGYTTKQEGSGLGLAISERVIRAHHGHLEIVSSEGVGTKVQVRIPVHLESEVQHQLRRVPLSRVARSASRRAPVHHGACGGVRVRGR